jgi:hypothetical protein
MSSLDLMNLIMKVLETQDIISHLSKGEITDEQMELLIESETKLPMLQDALSVMIGDENVVAANRELVELVKKIRLQEGMVAQAKMAQDKSMNNGASDSNVVRFIDDFKRKEGQLEDLRNEIRQLITHAQIMARGGEQLEELKNLLRREVEVKCAACEAARHRLAEVDPPAPLPVPVASVAAPAHVKKGWFGRGGRKTRRHKKRSNRQTRSRR